VSNSEKKSRRDGRDFRKNNHLVDIQETSISAGSLGDEAETLISWAACLYTNGIAIQYVIAI
jgi:hypothetical protein